MNPHQPAHQPRGNLDIGNLRGHGNHKGKIQKIQIIRLSPTRKTQTFIRFSPGRLDVAVVTMRIVEGKHDMGQQPGGYNGDAG